VEADLQEISIPILNPNKRTPRKETVIMKDEASERLERRSIAGSKNKKGGGGKKKSWKKKEKEKIRG
jgi:hypothetical protein